MGAPVPKRAHCVRPVEVRSVPSCPPSCLQVQKKADMVNEDLLSDGANENESGFWDSFKW